MMQESVDAEVSPLGDSGPIKKTSYRHRTLIVSAALILSIAITVPFFFSRHTLGNSNKEGIRVIQTHDLGNLLAMMDQFDKVLRSGVLYPRWTPDWNSGYGSANLNFYPPTLFYLSSLVHALLNDWVDTVFVISALGLAASGVAFYFLSRMFFSRLASSIAALVYMLLPFHQMDLYWRGGITQFIGYVFLPVVVYFAIRLGNEGRPRYYAAFGLMLGLYILTHLPVSYIFIYVLAVYAFIWSIKARDLRIMFRLAVGMALALTLSGMYWLPAALEAKYAYEWVSETFPYHLLYITLIPTPDPFSELIRMIFTFHAIALATTIVVLRKSTRAAIVEHNKKSLFAETQMSIWIILAIATISMCTSLSFYISSLIPKIELAVPPFRWLAIASLFLCLLVAASVERLRRSDLAPKTLLACRIALGAALGVNLLLTAHGVVIDALANPTHQQSAKYGDPTGIPRNSTLPHLLPNTETVVIKPGGAASEVIQWLPTHREVMVRVDQPSEIRLRTYNFPGWIATIDGQRVPVSSDNDGVQVLPVPAGRHKVETDFVDTPPRLAGKVLFAIGLLIIAALTFADYRRQAVRSKVDARLGSAKVATDTRHSDAIAEQQIGKAARNSTRRIITTLVLVATLVIAGFLFVRWFGSKQHTGVNGTAPGAAQLGAQVGARDVGSEARLSVGTLASIPVAVDEKYLDELMNAFSLRNDQRVEQLIQSGQVFRVNSNTRVRIIEFGSARIKVRILEGEKVMHDVWVPETWVK